jgi:hypothetical protein
VLLESGSLVYPVPYCIEHKFGNRGRTIGFRLVQSAGEENASGWVARVHGQEREPKVPVDAWNRAASLLGLTAEGEDRA